MSPEEDVLDVRWLANYGGIFSFYIKTCGDGHLLRFQLSYTALRAEGWGNPVPRLSCCLRCTHIDSCKLSWLSGTRGGALLTDFIVTTLHVPSGVSRQGDFTEP